jgi:DNA (cytosine-5)-methyltransferase 1
MLQGNAKAYVKRIKSEFEAAGYVVQLFLLNAASMGVPQKRERVFFVCQRNDLNLPKLKLRFDEKPILFGKFAYLDKTQDSKTTETALKYWPLCKQGSSFSSVANGSFFNWIKCSDKNVMQTIPAQTNYHYHSTINRPLNKFEYCIGGTYPLDYNFKDIKPNYLIGMSVPPVMTSQIAHQIYLQWFKTAE